VYNPFSEELSVGLEIGIRLFYEVCVKWQGYFLMAGSLVAKYKL
jgi:hypothetical protein